MSPLNMLTTALSSLTANKLRAGLTLLGIMIGVAAVIFLIALGRGAQASITSNIEMLGTNLVTITPGSVDTGGFASVELLFGEGIGESSALTLANANAVRDSVFTPSVIAVAPEISTGGQIVIRDVDFGSSVIGVTPEYETVRNQSVKWGSFISQVHVENNAMVAVLGSGTSEDMFGFRNPVGQSFRLNGRQFTVIGVLESQGASFGFDFLDYRVLVPVTTVHYRMSFDPTTQGEIPVDSINIQAKDTDSVESAIKEVTVALRLARRITNKNDFTVTSQQQAIAAVEDATGVFVIFLGGIAGISLLVGGIGIMNIMLVSVTERTREIGIRKAMGAKRRDILLQFIVESSMLSFSGGLIGLSIGLGLGFMLDGRDIFGPGEAFEMIVSGDIILLAMTVSVGIGLFFGIYPAARAARMHPIDALRYE